MSVTPQNAGRGTVLNLAAFERNPGYGRHLLFTWGVDSRPLLREAPERGIKDLGTHESAAHVPAANRCSTRFGYRPYTCGQRPPV